MPLKVCDAFLEEVMSVSGITSLACFEMKIFKQIEWETNIEITLYEEKLVITSLPGSMTEKKKRDLEKVWTPNSVKETVLISFFYWLCICIERKLKVSSVRNWIIKAKIKCNRIEETERVAWLSWQSTAKSVNKRTLLETNIPCTFGNQ